MLDDSDMMGGQSIWSRGSTEGKQLIPEGDNRYRQNFSEKFYVVQLVGTWVNVSEYAERVLHRKNRQSYVVFEGANHQLRPSRLLKPTLKQYTDVKCEIHNGGNDITNRNLDRLEPYPFIYIAPKIAREAFQAYFIDDNYEEWRRSQGWKPLF